MTYTYNAGGTSTIILALQVSTYSFDGTVKVEDGTEVTVPTDSIIEADRTTIEVVGGSVIALGGTVTSPITDGDTTTDDNTNTSDNSSSSTTSGTTTLSSTSTSPNTGDTVNVGLWASIVVLVRAVLGFFGYKKTKKNIIEE